MTAEKQSVDAISAQLVELRRDLGRVAVEHGLARKHCGHQTSWVIGLELLRDKSGSKSNIKEFRRMVRAIEADDSLPEYRLVVGSNDKVTFYVRDGGAHAGRGGPDAI